MNLKYYYRVKPNSIIVFFIYKRGEIMNSFLTWGLQTGATLVFGALTFFIKRSLDKIEKSIETNEKKIIETNKENEEKFEKITETINKLKEDLPKEYVLRDDFIRATSNIDQKLDKIYDIISKPRGGQ